MHCKCIRKKKLAEGEVCPCGAYQVRDGALVSLAYGAIDLFQREPVAYLPVQWRDRDECYAMATRGCVARCVHCTNHSYAHHPFTGKSTFQFSPQAIAKRCQSDGVALATDFVEPVNIADFVRDAFMAAQALDVPTILGTAGLLGAEALDEILPHTTLVRMDIKGASPAVLKKQGFQWGLDVVGMTAAKAQAYGCLLELTFCLIPGVNDSDAELSAIAEWIRSNTPNSPLTIIGHWKGGPKDLFAVAKPSEVQTARKWFAERLPNQVHIMEDMT